jgi:hypothetical protein
VDVVLSLLRGNVVRKAVREGERYAKAHRGNPHRWPCSFWRSSACGRACGAGGLLRAARLTACMNTDPGCVPRTPRMPPGRRMTTSIGLAYSEPLGATWTRYVAVGSGCFSCQGSRRRETEGGLGPQSRCAIPGLPTLMDVEGYAR